MHVIFNEQNPQLYTFPLPTEEIFQVEQNRLVAKHPAVDFRSQPLELRNFRFVFWYFGFLPLLEIFEHHYV